MNTELSVANIATGPEVSVAEKYTVKKIEYSENRLYNFSKRLLDITISVIALIIIFIPLVVIALIIKLDSKGPVIFRQERLGKNARPFTLYKFRTMYVDAEKDGPKWAEKNDERCTRFGRIIRKFRIDEFPQLINIIKGDMSIVGPRPERKYFYDLFETYIDGFDQRLYVLPGLTGLAQINGGYDLKPEEKVLHDIDYIETRSFLLDLKIIFKTIRIVFTRYGAR